MKSTKTRPGNHYLQGALGAAAMACAQNPSTYLGARYRRITARRDPQKANVAIRRSMLTAIWHMGRTGTLYDDPGADFFTHLHPERAKTAHSTSWKPWATKSPSTASGNRLGPAAQGIFASEPPASCVSSRAL